MKDFHSARTSLVRIIFIGFLFCLYLQINPATIDGNGIIFAMLSIGLIAYIFYELYRLYLIFPYGFFVNPALICSLVLFLFGYGLTNFIFFLPEESASQYAVIPEISIAMVRHEFLVGLGALMLFTGYWSSIGKNICDSHSINFFQKKFLLKPKKISSIAVIVFITIGFLSRLIAIYLGLYGYGGDYSEARLLETASYSQYLNIGAGFGRFALVLSALSYFSFKNNRIIKNDYLLFWASLVIELFFGFISGMKSGVMIPIAIGGVCYYLRREKIPRAWFLVSILSVVVAYLVIEPFRDFRNLHGGNLNSIIDIVEILYESAFSDNKREDTSLLASLVSRNNLVYIGSFAVEYSDTHEILPIGSPEFLMDILTSPFRAVIPRILWEGKPLGRLGVWYNQVVLGSESSTSVAMGPFAYLYLAGSYYAVAICFFIIGLIQRVFFSILVPWRSYYGAALYLILISDIAIIETSIDGIVINVIRDFTISFLLIILITRKPNGLRQPN